jgi:hypothetical protein
MAPLVIILPTVVVVIVLAVFFGLRLIKRSERADLASDGPVGRGRGSSGQDDEWRAPRQRAGAQRPAARGQAAERPARDDHGKKPRSLRAGRGDDNAEVVQLKGRPDARAKQAKSKRSGDDGDWPSTEWDDLSDADYWKEVASDRPLVTMARTAAPESSPAGPGELSRPATGAQPAASAQATARQAQDAQTLLQAAAAPQRDREPRRSDREPRRSGRESRRDRAAASHDSGQPAPGTTPRPVPGLPQRAAAGASAGYGPDYLGAPLASPALDPPRPAHYPPAMAPVMSAPAAASMAPAARPRAVPQPLDDDPLTSPSFPRIVTSDSRSYHSNGGRSAAAPAAPSPAPAERADYSGATTSIFPRYGSPALPPASGEPAGYPPAATVAGTAPHSYAPDGYAPDGYTPDGYAPDGYAPDGYAPASHAPASHAPDGYDSGGYDRAGLDAAYSLPSQPSTSYDSSPGMVNGYGPTGPGTAHSPAAQDTTAAYAAPQYQSQDHEVPAAAPAGNPYGSYVSSSDYVSTDLPGYTPSLAAAYPPGQPATSYLPGPAAGRSSDPYAQDYAPAAATPDSWYPPAPGAPGASGSHRGPDSGAEPAPAGYPDPAGYGPPGYSGRHHDAPGYSPAGYDGPGSAPGSVPPGGQHAGQQDTAAYLPPDYYSRDSRDEQARW